MYELPDFPIGVVVKKDSGALSILDHKDFESKEQMLDSIRTNNANDTVTIYKMATKLDITKKEILVCQYHDVPKE